MIKKSSTGSGPKVDLRKGTGCGMQTKSAFGEDRASSSSKKVYAPAGTARVLPDDLTITIGLLIKNSYESEIAELEAELQELREASIPDVQTALWEELDTAEEAETPFKVTKALLAEKEDWLTLEMLFDDWMLAQLGPRMKEAVIYEHLVKELADNPRDFMEEFFRSGGEQEEAQAAAQEARHAADRQATENRILLDAMAALRQEASDARRKGDTAGRSLQDAEDAQRLLQAQGKKLQAQLEIALSESRLQKSLNQQLMNRKQEMEWQLLTALSKSPPASTFSNDAAAAAQEESMPARLLHDNVEDRQTHGMIRHDGK
ncbi:hypothetical protein WJX74_002884 [Apatococcus lobatus]|uniref:Uncharacterized protein n=1 Tax=Apatococcus lobatus TaxID=904363 RepID=A0AAW1SEP4_9CHLO